MADRANLHLIRRKTRDRSIALLIAGAVLLTPPLAGISLIDGNIGGVPIPLLYIFAVWIMLITGAGLLSRPLIESDDLSTSTETTEPES